MLQLFVTSLRGHFTPLLYAPGWPDRGTHMDSRPHLRQHHQVHQGRKQNVISQDTTLLSETTTKRFRVWSGFYLYGCLAQDQKQQHVG